MLMVSKVKALRKIGQVFYGIAIIVYGILQLCYGNFRSVQLPLWQNKIPGLNIVAYITGVLMIYCGYAIIAGKKGKTIVLILGLIFFLLCLLVHVPYELFGNPNKVYHLGLWEDTLKELALAGGAFVVADSFYERSLPRFLSTKSIYILQQSGKFFFCTTMIAFGIAHFLYINYIQQMVPSWMPDHILWAYIGGVALIGAGACIVLDIQRTKIALLLAIMLLLWFFLLHVPGAIAYQFANRSNSIASAFDALAFSGTAFLMAINNSLNMSRQKSFYEADLQC